MFSTCRGRSRIADGSSCRAPLRRLKLTSRARMLLEDITSNGRPSVKELWDRLMRNRTVRSARDGEMHPWRPLDARETSMTAPFPLQVMPSHAQQSVSFCHDKVRLPSCESPATNWRSELFSCSVRKLAGEAKQSSSTTARPKDGMINLLLLLLLPEKRGAGCVTFLTKLSWIGEVQCMLEHCSGRRIIRGNTCPVCLCVHGLRTIEA